MKRWEYNCRLRVVVFWQTWWFVRRMLTFSSTECDPTWMDGRNRTIYPTVSCMKEFCLPRMEFPMVSRLILESTENTPEEVLVKVRWFTCWMPLLISFMLPWEVLIQQRWSTLSTRCEIICQAHTESLFMPLRIHTRFEVCGFWVPVYLWYTSVWKAHYSMLIQNTWRICHPKRKELQILSHSLTSALKEWRHSETHTFKWFLSTLYHKPTSERM